ncbi:hypothetical protein ABID99_003580 [Mucilaginibacter sp. OAE612]|uniref:hypothetical protein n=1 Tax=Mucilaginibacter sp. OAE612 TaxID=3156444 RepID=UPI00359E5634
MMITEKVLSAPNADGGATPGASGRRHLNAIQKVSLTYLFSVPFLTFLLGFGVGHVNWQWYVPAWLINILIMALAMRQLPRSHPSGSRLAIVTALLLIAPWIIFPLFAGMGRPPQTIQGWLDLEGEQHTRFNLLILGGILAYLGTTSLYQLLQHKEKTFAALGLALMTLAIPLFLINMAYWGSFLSASFQSFKTSNRPDWYLAFRELFFVISTAEVSLIYLATAMFAMALGRTGYLKFRAVRAYVIISLCAGLLNLVPPSAPDFFSTMSYLVSIPAIPFIMFYFMGIKLLYTRPECP